MDRFHGNAKVGKGEYFVAEADESDSSFHHLRPKYAVVTNVEMEHMDHYGSLDDIKQSYRKFIGNLKPGGKVFFCRDDRNIIDMLEGYKGKASSYGFDDKADIYARDIVMKEFATSFECVYHKRAIGRVELRIPGRHNVLNALAAILTGLNIGIKFETIAASLKEFRGAKRRFQLKADSGGVMVIDDYAHHPTEIRAVIDACKNWNGKRVIAVFQPHRYSRVRSLLDDFVNCFKGVDKLILTDIYAASEKPIPGVSSKKLCENIRRGGHNDVVLMKKEKIVDHLLKTLS